MVRHYYSPIYEENNYGFFIKSKKNHYYLGYRYKTNGKEIMVNISKETYSTLRDEWK